MKQIKTIKNRLDNVELFDDDVNAALAEGWTLTRRDIIRPNAHPYGETSFTMLYAELERNDAVHPDIEKIFDYIDKACSRPHGDSFWIDENGLRATLDSGEAIGWWYEHMKPELLRFIDAVQEHEEGEAEKA